MTLEFLFLLFAWSISLPVVCLVLPSGCPHCLLLPSCCHLVWSYLTSVCLALFSNLTLSAVTFRLSPCLVLPAGCHIVLSSSCHLVWSYLQVVIMSDLTFRLSHCLIFRLLPCLVFRLSQCLVLSPGCPMSTPTLLP